MTGLRKADFVDVEIVDQEELGSDGSLSIFTGATVTSCTSSTKRVVCSGTLFINGDTDETLEPKDVVTIAGSTAADGTYTVDSIVSDTEFDVVEAISDSTGGTLSAVHPPGARKVGFDSTGLTHTTADNLQDAIEDLDGAISDGGITEAQHEALDTLTHDLTESHTVTITKASGKVSQVLAEVTPGGTDIRKVDILTRTGGKVNTLRVTQYAANGTTIERQLDLTLNRTDGKVTSITVVRTV